jgi:DNA (cytosine-5)-methyltransferase 1
MNFYNEFDPFAAQWIENLIAQRCIPEGRVDARSITEVRAEDLVGYRQCHWYCGIAGWPEAFRLAGISGCRGIWSKSLPCQPLSSAGKQRGAEDERHLWPESYRLISECRPSLIFGEQSGSKLGREWLDGVFLDLEELGFAVAASDLPAASVGAPHIRQRLYWGAVRLADSKHDARFSKHEREQGRWVQEAIDAAECCRSSWMADTSDGDGRRGISGEETGTGQDGQRGIGPASSGTACRLGYSSCDDQRRDQFRGAGPTFGIAAGGSGSGMVDSICSGLEGYAGNGNSRDESGRIDSGTIGPTSSSDPWSDWYPVFCRDEKTRRVGSAVQPLAASVPRNMGSLESELLRLGVDAKRSTAMRKWAGSRLAKAGRNRVGRLRAYGNAIVPPLAAQFIRSFLKSVLDVSHCENGG